jgi:hypothetical protein
MNRLQVLAELRQLGLGLDLEEEAALLDAIFDKPYKSKRAKCATVVFPMEYSFNTLNEMAFEGACITEGMKQLYEEDDSTNKNLRSNFYMNI